MTLLYQGIAKAVDKQYELMDFESWADLAAHEHDDTIGLVGRAIRVPRIILLTEYDRLPKRRVRFSRHNIYLRDRNTCQYCAKMFSKAELNLDHVVPRSQGGRTTWENVVCSCIECNRQKGGRTPEEAKMRLRKQPRRPEWSPLYGFQGRAHAYEAWKPFLNVVDASYWNVELKD
jgi:5-methylcytosine-specific restriction endonuclease McrA